MQYIINTSQDYNAFQENYYTQVETSVVAPSSTTFDSCKVYGSPPPLVLEVECAFAPDTITMKSIIRLLYSHHNEDTNI